MQAEFVVTRDALFQAIVNKNQYRQLIWCIGALQRIL